MSRLQQRQRRGEGEPAEQRVPHVPAQGRDAAGVEGRRDGHDEPPEDPGSGRGDQGRDREAHHEQRPGHRRLVATRDRLVGIQDRGAETQRDHRAADEHGTPPDLAGAELDDGDRDAGEHGEEDRDDPDAVEDPLHGADLLAIPGELLGDLEIRGALRRRVAGDDDLAAHVIGVLPLERPVGTLRALVGLRLLRVPAPGRDVDAEDVEVRLGLRPRVGFGEIRARGFGGEQMMLGQDGPGGADGEREFLLLLRLEEPHTPVRGGTGARPVEAGERVVRALLGQDVLRVERIERGIDVGHVPPLRGDLPQLAQARLRGGGRLLAR